MSLYLNRLSYAYSMGVDYPPSGFVMPVTPHRMSFLLNECGVVVLITIKGVTLPKLRDFIKEIMDALDDSLLDKTSFYKQQREFTELADDASKDSTALPDSYQSDFIDFLAITQWRNIDLLPITWQQMLSTINVGGTARMKQSIVNRSVNLAFKCLHLERVTDEGRKTALRLMMNEVAVLGHPIIRSLPYFIRLEGVCWDFSNDAVWPVLVFKKADQGNLREFLKSEIGKGLDFAQRLQICSEIGSAVMTMHAYHMIHGDLKPENVLIFNNETEGYLAKVADFGYSGLSLERAEEEQFQLPISRPWNPPEITEWNSMLRLSAARKADIYSFGLLCLWILFYDSLQTNAEGAAQRIDDMDQIQMLKEKDQLFSFAKERIGQIEGLGEEEIEGLILFFSWSLNPEPENRYLPIDVSKAAKSMFFKQKNSEPFNSIEDENSFKSKLGNLSWMGIQCKDLEDHTRPFGYLHYYPSQIGSHDMGYNIDLGRWTLADVIPTFMVSDYRLWDYLRQCYENRYTHENRDIRFRRDAAFQLAILSSLRLGLSKEAIETSTWLLRSERPDEDLASEIDRIRRIKVITFKSTDVDVDFIDLINHYRELGILEKAQKEYQSTADYLETLFSDSHPFVVRLRILNAKALQDLGQLQEAQRELVALATATERGLGEENANTIWAKLQLVLLWIDISAWSQAQALQIDVLAASIRAFGEESEQAQISMGNLGAIYWNLRQLEKAEELQSQHLDFLQRTRGKRHIKTLTTMNNLSSTYEYQGRTEDALKLKLEALAISKEINGEEHHYTLSIITNIANNYRRQKRLKDAEELEIKLVAARKRQFGDDHMITLRAMGNLASTYALQGRPREAEPLERHVASILATQLDSKHQDLLTARNNLSHTLKDLGQMDEAICTMKDVVRGRTEVLGPDHPETKRSLGNLQLWQQMSGY